MNNRGRNRSFSINNSPLDNRRGQELSTTTIILIILGVIILVVMIIGFSVGWNKILPQLSSNNVQTISTQCVTACSTNSVYDFCSRPFDLISDKATIKNATCNFLAQKQAQYGISACSSITCNNIVLLNNPTPAGAAAFTTKTFVASPNSASGPCSLDPSYPGQTLETLISGTVYTITCPEPAQATP